VLEKGQQRIAIEIKSSTAPKVSRGFLNTIDVFRANERIALAYHKQKCERCHRNNGAEPVEDAAILAGQWTP
jgi:hypothetical protein